MFPRKDLTTPVGSRYLETRLSTRGVSAHRCESVAVEGTKPDPFEDWSETRDSRRPRTQKYKDRGKVLKLEVVEELGQKPKIALG